MRFLADECVSGHIVRCLRRQQHDVLWIKEFRPGERDLEVLDYSFANQRILLTEDRGFGELAMRFKKPALGIVIIAVPALEGNADANAEIVVQRLNELGDGLIGWLTILEAVRTRRRELAR